MPSDTARREQGRAHPAPLPPRKSEFLNTVHAPRISGEENFFLFGLTAQQVADSRGRYNPHWHYDNEPETRAVLDLIFSDYFSRYEPGAFKPPRETLLTNGDHYMHLADFKSYLEADRRIVELYGTPTGRLLRRY